MRYLLLFIFSISLNFCYAQTDPVLDAYLATHRYAIRIEKDSSTSFPDGTLPALLVKKMEDKKLFVFAESFSHQLNMNKTLRRMFMQHLAAHGLKYYFEESARSWVVEDYLQMSGEIKIDGYWGYAYRDRSYYKKEKAAYQKGHFEYIATDFERAQTFQRTIAILVGTTDKNNRQKLYQLAPYMQDTSYRFLKPRKFVQFYQEQQAKFYTDSNSFKPLLGKAYPYFRYLMDDPMPSSYNNNRNKNMALHLLQQIDEHPSTTDKYLLSIGSGHIKYRDGLMKTTLGRLRDSEQLKDKILVATLYCEQCHATDNSGNAIFDFMADDAVRSLQKAANSDMVLFDLTELPDQYKYINDRFDIIVYGKNLY